MTSSTIVYTIYIFIFSFIATLAIICLSFIYTQLVVGRAFAVM